METFPDARRVYSNVGRMRINSMDPFRRGPMRALTLPLFTATLLASASTIPAQGTRSKDKPPSPDRVTIERGQRGPDVRVFMREGGPWSGARSMIGVSTTSTGPRDTLGLLITGVTPNGPAEKAAIVEGNRIAAINGVNLRLTAADAGQDDMDGITARRLSRELSKVDPGTDVELRIYADGQWKTVKLTPVSPDSLMPVRMRMNGMEDRAVLGIELNSTGSKRDTLGVFIGAVHDGGPADKAGLIEGDRVASVNGTDLRVRHDDAGDDWVSGAMVTRFQRVMRSAKPGDKVELRVWSGGQSKTVQVTAAKASELYKDQMKHVRIGGQMMFGPDGDTMPPGADAHGMMAPMPPMPPMAPMGGFFSPRARVQSLDMDDEDGLAGLLVDLNRSLQAAGAGSDAEDALRAMLSTEGTAAVDAYAEARARAGTRRRRSSGTIRAPQPPREEQRAPLSSAANLFGVVPALAATWSANASHTAEEGIDAASSRRIQIPGLSVAQVTPDLAEYLGEGSEQGYLVLASSGPWSALRAGDVLLSVDGDSVNDAGITTSNTAREVVVLRKGKKLILHLAGG